MADGKETELVFALGIPGQISGSQDGGKMSFPCVYKFYIPP